MKGKNIPNGISRSVQRAKKLEEAAKRIIYISDRIGEILDKGDKATEEECKEYLALQEEYMQKYFGHYKYWAAARKMRNQMRKEARRRKHD